MEWSSVVTAGYLLFCLPRLTKGELFGQGDDRQQLRI